MPDRNGLSSWAERDANFHLQTSLQAFERAFFDSEKETGFPRTKAWMQELKEKRTNTVEVLASRCREQLRHKEKKLPTKDLSNPANNHKENVGAPAESFWKDTLTFHRLTTFLPSLMGFQCLKLAEEAVRRVEAGSAQSAYVHRGSRRGEKWSLGITNNDENGWTMDVDCGGFVRNVIQSATGSPLLVSLSDRDYMRAKDFYTFFERLEYCVTDHTAPSTGEGKQIQWRRVNDLRTVMAGDIIVYRAKGGAAGGSVFTKKDSLTKALTAVKTAELYDIKDEELGDQHVDINVAKLPEVSEWVRDVIDILKGVGVESIDQLRGDNDGANDEDNDDNLQTAITALEQEGKLTENTVSLLQEVLSSNNGNTGHIMFAAGPAEETSQATHIWRVPVYHSTGVGPKRKRGVQRAYKRFEYSAQYQKWTRGGPRDDVEGGHIEVVVGRICG